jgi:hypothetical protein
MAALGVRMADTVAAVRSVAAVARWLVVVVAPEAAGNG